VSATTDPFARFLEILADTMDDHEAQGDAVASRVPLSRYHFDRLVSAAAGEPPAALRRRILLERLPAGRREARVEISVEGIDSEPTLRSLLARLVGQLAMWDAAIHDRPYDMGVERTESITRLRAKLAEVGPAFAAHRRALVCGALADVGVTDLGAGDPVRWVAWPAA
jgi:hypothetical protein